MDHYFKCVFMTDDFKFRFGQPISYYGLLFSFLFRVSTMILWYIEVSLLSTEYRPVSSTFGTLKVGPVGGRFFQGGCFHDVGEFFITGANNFCAGSRFYTAYKIAGGELFMANIAPRASFSREFIAGRRSQALGAFLSRDTGNKIVASLLPICCWIQGIHVAEIQVTCCRQQAT